MTYAVAAATMLAAAAAQSASWRRQPQHAAALAQPRARQPVFLTEIMSTTSEEGKAYLGSPRGGFGGPVIASHKGVAMAFFDGHKYLCADDPGQHDILCQRSANRGRNWTNCGAATGRF